MLLNFLLLYYNLASDSTTLQTYIKTIRNALNDNAEHTVATFTDNKTRFYYFNLHNQNSVVLKKILHNIHTNFKEWYTCDLNIIFNYRTISKDIDLKLMREINLALQKFNSFINGNSIFKKNEKYFNIEQMRYDGSFEKPGNMITSFVFQIWNRDDKFEMIKSYFKKKNVLKITLYCESKMSEHSIVAISRIIESKFGSKQPWSEILIVVSRCNDVIFDDVVSNIDLTCFIKTDFTKETFIIDHFSNDSFYKGTDLFALNYRITSDKNANLELKFIKHPNSLYYPMCLNTIEVIYSKIYIDHDNINLEIIIINYLTCQRFDILLNFRFMNGEYLIDSIIHFKFNYQYLLFDKKHIFNPEVFLNNLVSLFSYSNRWSLIPIHDVFSILQRTFLPITGYFLEYAILCKTFVPYKFIISLNKTFKFKYVKRANEKLSLLKRIKTVENIYTIAYSERDADTKITDLMNDYYNNRLNMNNKCFTGDYILFTDTEWNFIIYNKYGEIEYYLNIIRDDLNIKVLLISANLRYDYEIHDVMKQIIGILKEFETESVTKIDGNSDRAYGYYKFLKNKFGY